MALLAARYAAMAARRAGRPQARELAEREFSRDVLAAKLLRCLEEVQQSAGPAGS